MALVDLPGESLIKKLKCFIYLDRSQTIVSAENGVITYADGSKEISHKSELDIQDKYNLFNTDQIRIFEEVTERKFENTDFYFGMDGRIWYGKLGGSATHAVTKEFMKELNKQSHRKNFNEDISAWYENQMLEIGEPTGELPNPREHFALMKLKEGLKVTEKDLYPKE